MNESAAALQDGTKWALERLSAFAVAAARVHVPAPSGVISGGSYRTTEPDDEVVRQWAVVEKILSRHLPDWRSRVQEPDGYSYPGYRWRDQREGALACIASLQAHAEVQQFLSDDGPTMNAASLHPWIWDAARPAWQASNFDDAVDAASRNLNSRLRSKVGRKDIGEGDLVANVFSDKPGDEQSPRLRLNLAEELGDKTISSIYQGISAFGKGLFQAVRNPLAHEHPGALDTTEQQALECLAAFSLLARWIDQATVQRS
jgi:uncharacterized protein (TIGR02391 family)